VVLDLLDPEWRKRQERKKKIEELEARIKKMKRRRSG